MPELAVALTLGAPLSQKAASAVENLDPMILKFDYIYVAGRIHGHIKWIVELVIFHTVAAQAAEECAG